MECWDFDERAAYVEFAAAARSCGLGDLVERIESGYSDATPGDGIRWLVRYPECGRRERQKEIPMRTFERVAELVEEHDAAARRGDVTKCKEIRANLMDTSGRDSTWGCIDEDGKVRGWDGAKLAVLQDIRRRLDTIIERLPEKEPRA